MGQINSAPSIQQMVEKEFERLEKIDNRLKELEATIKTMLATMQQLSKEIEQMKKPKETFCEFLLSKVPASERTESLLKILETSVNVQSGWNSVTLGQKNSVIHEHIVQTHALVFSQGLLTRKIAAIKQFAMRTLGSIQQVMNQWILQQYGTSAQQTTTMEEFHYMCKLVYNVPSMRSMLIQYLRLQLPVVEQTQQLEQEEVADFCSYLVQLMIQPSCSYPPLMIICPKENDPFDQLLHESINETSGAIAAVITPAVCTCDKKQVHIKARVRTLE